MVRRFLFGCLASLIFFVFPISALAYGEAQSSYNSSNNMVKPYWTEISEYSNTFDILSGGKASVEVILYAFDVDEINVQASLQQYKNGVWTTIKSWSKTSKDISCGIGEYWYINSGYSYRMISTGTVYKNGVQAEQTTYTSDIRQY